jgi:hypothetical protein
MGGDDELIEYEWTRDTGIARMVYEKQDGTQYIKEEYQGKYWSVPTLPTREH